MKKTLADNELAIIEVENGIVSLTFKIDLIDLELVKKIVDTRLEVTSLEPYLFLINSKKVKKFSKEARDFLAGKKAAERVIAAAIVIDSMLTATLANFFLRVSKPEVTTRLFSNEEDAIIWLKTIDTDK